MYITTDPNIDSIRILPNGHYAIPYVYQEADASLRRAQYCFETVEEFYSYAVSIYGETIAGGLITLLHLEHY